MSSVPGAGRRRVVAVALSLVFLFAHFLSAAHLLSCRHVLDPRTGEVLDVCLCGKEATAAAVQQGPTMGAVSGGAAGTAHACAFAWGLPGADPSVVAPDGAVAGAAPTAVLFPDEAPPATAIPLFLLAPGHSPPASA
jgi:hypothetical protein